MATSGSVNFTQTAADVIKDALLLLGVISEDETPHASTQAVALRFFNKMIKGLQNQNGLHLWRLGRGVCLLNADTIAYTFHNKSGTGGSVGAGILQDSLVRTTISADEATAQTVISVTSSTGMSASDKVIILLDDGTRHETTIVSVDSSTQITITSGLASAAGSGNTVYAYTLTTDEIKYPEELYNVRIRFSDGLETALHRVARDEYMNYANKTLEGIPYSYYFDRQLTNPVLRVYPEPTNLADYIVFDYVRTIEDLDALTDNIYFPDHWLEALTYGLAVRLAAVFNRPEKAQELGGFAGVAIQAAKENDTDDVPFQFQPELRK